MIATFGSLARRLVPLASHIYPTGRAHIQLLVKAEPAGQGQLDECCISYMYADL